MTLIVEQWVSSTSHFVPLSYRYALRQHATCSMSLFVYVIITVIIITKLGHTLAHFGPSVKVPSSHLGRRLSFQLPVGWYFGVCLRCLWSSICM